MIDEKKDELIKKHFELKEKIDKLTEEDDFIRKEIRSTMEDDDIKDYKDKYGNKVSLNPSHRDSIDKDGLIMQFGEERIRPFITTKDFVILKITTAEAIDNYKKMMNPKKNKFISEEGEKNASNE